MSGVFVRVFTLPLLILTFLVAPVTSRSSAAQPISAPLTVPKSLVMSKSVGKWKISVRKDEKTGTQKLEVMNADTNIPLISYTPSSAMEQIRDVEEVKLDGYNRPLLVTIWYTGVHSQMLLIFDPALRTKAMMTSLYSVWTVDYAPNDDHLDIDFYEEASPNTLSTIEWMPGVKIGLSDNQGSVSEPAH